MANEIRVGAIVDASQIPGGLDTLLTALSQARSAYNTASVESAASLARLRQAHKDLDKAGADTRDTMVAALSQAQTVYSATTASAEELRAKVQGLELQLSTLGIAAKTAAAATGDVGNAAKIAASYQENLAASAARAAMAETDLGAAMGAAAAQAAQGPASLGGVMAGAAQSANELTPALNGVGSASSAASIPIFRIYALLFMVRRALDALEKFRESEEQLKNFAAASGISAQKIAEFQGAIEIAGGHGERFDAVVLHLARSMEQAQRGNKTLADEMSRLGIAGMTDPIEAFMKMADTIHNTSDRMAALEAASRLTGASSSDLIGVMSSGSEVLRKNMEASRELATARVAAIDSANELTRIEGMLKTALDSTAGEALPAIIQAIKALAAGFDSAILPIKVLFDAIIFGSIGAYNALGNLGTLAGDAMSGKWSKMAVDAKVAIEEMKLDFLHMGEEIKTDVEATQKFIDGLYAPKEKPDPGGKGGKIRPPTDPNALKKAEDVLRKADQEAFADLQADHQLTIREEIKFWEERLRTESQYADRVREIKRTLGHDYQRLDREEFSLRQKIAREGAKAIEDEINEGSQRAQANGGDHGKRDELAYLQEQATKLANEIVNGSAAAAIAYDAVMRKIPAVAREAAAESEHAIKKSLENQFRLWEESGTRTLQQQKDFWTNAVLLATGWEELDYALTKYAETSRKAADEQRKLVIELRNLKTAADESSASFGIAMEREQLKGKADTRLFPATNSQKVGDLKANRALDQREGDNQQDAAYSKYEGASLDQFFNPTRENITKTEAAWNEYQKTVQKTQLKIATDNVAIAHQMIQPWQKVFQTLDQGLSQTFTDMLMHGKTFASGMVGVGKQLEEQMIGNWIKLAESWVQNQIKMTIAHTVAKQTQVGVDAATASQAQGISLAAHIKEILLHAKGAAAAGFHSGMKLPFPANVVVAPTLAAAAFAGVMAFGSAERGAVLPDHNTMIFAHAREMILPRHLSVGIQNMIERGGGGGGGDTHHHHYGGITVSGASGDHQQIGSAVRGELRKWTRDNHHRI